MKFNPHEFEKFLKQLCVLAKDSRAAHERARQRETDNNNKTLDVMHVVELAPSMLGDTNLAELLTDIRQDRREAKTERIIAEKFEKWADANRPAINQLEQMLGDVRKTIEAEEREKFYTFKTDLIGRRGEYLRPDEKGETDENND